MGVAPAPDGSDRHLTANHLGPYLLTRLLLPHMTAVRPLPSPAPACAPAAPAASTSAQANGSAAGSGDASGSSGKGEGAGAGDRAAGAGAWAGGGGGGGGGRVVNVASRAHFGGRLALVTGPPGSEAIANDIRHWWWQYARSKLCNVLFTAELQRRYGAGGGGGGEGGGGAGGRYGITATAVSPGLVDTGIFR